MTSVAHSGKFTRRIGMRTRGSGGLGNRLFQMSLLHALGEVLESSVIRPKDKGLGRLEATHLQYAARPLLFGEKVPVNFIARGDFWQLCEYAESRQKLGEAVILPRGALGPFFLAGNSAVNYRKYFQLEAPIDARSSTIYLHFRGRDFAQWDPLAIMNSSFYEQAVAELCEFDPSARLACTELITDDACHPTALSLVKSFGPEPILGSESSDFDKLASGSYVVASPSTFSFWAAFLGSSVWVISRKWHEINATHTIPERRRFWLDLLEVEVFRGEVCIGFDLGAL